MNQNCAWCGKHRSEVTGMSGYTDEKHNIGRKNEYFTGGLLPITLCDNCLLGHVKKYYPDCQIQKAIEARLEYAGEIQSEIIQPKLI